MLIAPQADQGLVAIWAINKIENGRFIRVADPGAMSASCN
jgi:hypothetical protein